MLNHFTLTVWGRGAPARKYFCDPSYVVNRIYYIVSGSAKYKDQVLLRPGYLYLFSADSNFLVTQDAEYPTDHLFFDFRTFLHQIRPGVTEVDLSDKPALRDVVLSAAQAFENTMVPLPVAESYFRIIMYFLEAYYTSLEGLSYVTESALRCLHDSPISEISVQSLAQQCNVNVNHLIRCFKRDLGVTPHRYISRLKVDLAISSIRRGERIPDIAAALGFSSVSALSVFFKNETGRNLSDSRV